MSLTLQISAGTLPSGFCPSGYQDILNTFSQNQTVTIPNSNTGIVVSASKPVDTTVVWLQLDTFGRPSHQYFFAQGEWLSLHPMVPGSTIIWTGPLPDFTTFDGGDANALSSISGPMWKVVLPAVFPLGAGTLPSGKVVNSGDTGGEENHQLVLSEIPPHTHDVQLTHGESYLGAPNSLIAGNGANNPQPETQPGGALSSGGDPGSGTPPTKSLAHNTMPPYTGVIFIQRTTRLFYAVT